MCMSRSSWQKFLPGAASFLSRALGYTSHLQPQGTTLGNPEHLAMIPALGIIQ